MDQLDWERLPGPLRERLSDARPQGRLYEIRLRAGAPIQLLGEAEDRSCGEALTARQIAQIASALMEYSLYAWGDELARGYFATGQGFRVGVGGRYRMVDGQRRLTDIHSLCIRVARQEHGCAESLLPQLKSGSCLILSPPGCGKTTLLRELARRLSDNLRSLVLIDERCEIAAAWQGIPTMDVGSRTDVIEGVDKPTGIPMAVRALAPQLLITDELGGDADAEAVLDAIRCGVRVIASAHAASLEAAKERTSLKRLLQTGFDVAIELKMPPGTIGKICRRNGSEWTPVGIV